ncbi:MAG TPA: hypothetical protein VNW15_06700 [Rhizomicrobium sp.]|nr:hypothetical protein [Rhizomicrobium sp.]
MKLLSGMAPIAPKNFPLIALAITTLGIGSSPAAFAQARNAPSPKTEAALECRIGLGPEGCETAFEVSARHYHNRCNNQYVFDRLDGCPDGPLEAVEYLGTNAAGDDIYTVKYMNAVMTVVIFSPAPDGKRYGFRFFDSPPNMAIGSSKHSVTVTSPADPVQILYSRPRQESQAG